MSAITAAVLATAVLITITIFAVAGAQESSKVYAPDEKPFGLSYGQWSVKWWQWSLGIPMADNPAGDETGEKCGQAQKDQNVWFLAGTFGGPVTRNCTVPQGKAILLPVVNNECSYLEFPAYKTEQELTTCATSLIDKATNLKVSIDGVNFPDLNKYRFQSSLYNFTIPANNVLGLAPGTTDSSANGYWIMLKPLSKGSHTIEFGGSILDVSTTSNVNFATDATYHLIVQ
jgi:hypothetical protein